MARRVAVIKLHESAIIKLLSLPEGMSVRSVHDDGYWNGFSIVVESEDLPETHEGCELPRLPGDVLLLPLNTSDMQREMYFWAPSRITDPLGLDDEPKVMP